MELNGFMIGPEINQLFTIKIGTLIVEHPVVREVWWTLLLCLEEVVGSNKMQIFCEHYL